MVPPLSCFSQFAYLEGPPVYLRRPLDTLWAVWGQFKLTSFLVPACTCSQNLQYPLKHTVACFDLLHLSFLGWFSLLSFAQACTLIFDPTPLVLVAQMVKNLPAKWETWVRFLGLEGALGEGMATHFSINAWRMPWTEEPGRLLSVRSQRVGHS